jgi:hypothetical protein
MYFKQINHPKCYIPMQLEETLAFTRIHEADDHDQWNGHINEIAKKIPPKLLEGNHCAVLAKPKQTQQERVLS